VAIAADIELLRADNPGPFTLEGTNTWLVGRDPCWVVDPGPALAGHLDAVAAAGAARGGIAGIVLTHDHRDHAEGVPGLLERAGSDVEVVAARAAAATTSVGHGDSAGPFEVIATPGHAPDHLAYRHGDALFSGDAVLGRGSVFIAPDPGALRGYLAALDHLLTLDLATIHPGHGPLVTDPAGKIAEYRDHRLDRERRLVTALAGGLRSVDDLLDAVWSDAPAVLRPAAAVTLAAHLDKLAEEGTLPAGVDRPAFSM
jgi:glyoxylase-like metal-dependent hydrolase (beta-lactamase superfamily II)